MLTISNTTPAAVVAEARKLIDKPYRHLGRGPVAYDCLGVLLTVAKATRQIDPDFDYRDYTEDTSHYQLELEIAKHMTRLRHWQDAEPGDVLLQRFHVAQPASHIIIISQRVGDYRWGIHASRRLGRCLEQIVAHYERNHAAFRLKGVEPWQK
jgi:cell wall-associated NlpC family hydrolase